MLGDPASGRDQRTRVHLAAMHAAGLAAAEQAGALQHLEVPGNGGERNVEGTGELAGRGFAARQPGEDGAPRRVGERGEGAIERGP